MKKLLCLILAVSFLLPILGCSDSEPKDPGTFYYRRTETSYDGSDGVIAPETRDLSEIRGNTQALLEEYLSGPASSGMESPFPRNTSLVSWKIMRNTLQINLSQEFAQLSGIELTIACSCLAKTFLELTEATSVRIHAEGALLGGSENITITANDLQLFDDSVEKLRTDLTLYYTDESRRYLIGQTRSINLAAQDDIVAYLIDQLMTAPTGMSLVSPLPQGTKLLSSVIENGVCTLDFSSEFENSAFSQSHAQRTTLLSVVNTLTQLEQIDRVEFKLDGNLIVRYRHLGISKPLVYDESAIGPVRTGVNEFDATLYLRSGSSLYLAAVPTRIRNTTGISQAELVVRKLLTYKNDNGFSTCIPNGITLHGLTVADSVCTINLSKSFLSAEDLTMAVHVIVSSVCAVDGINAAQILIEGKIPETEASYLFTQLTPEADWFA